MTVRGLAVGLVKYGLLAAALGVTAGASALVTMRVVLVSQEVKVPELVGKRVPEAAALAARRRLVLKVEGGRHDPAVPADAIAIQEPLPGSTLKTNRSVRVWTSLGPRRVQVPTVEGQTLRTGRLALEQASVPVSRVVEVHDAAPEGTILQQHPAAGEADSVAAGASLLVSLGPGRRDYLMPDLIGRPAEEVAVALQRAGLKLGDLRYRSYPGVAPGTILRHLPPAGHRVGPQVSITLDVSRSE